MSVKMNARKLPRAKGQILRAAIEALEGRTLLSTTYMVTTLADSGAGSLRQAITDANTAGGTSTIDFKAGLTGNVASSTPLPDIDSNMTLHGPGASVISIQGTATAVALYVAGGATAEIDNISIANGGSSNNQYDGGGIANFGILTVVDSTISGNTTAASGGGIYNSQSATLTVTDSTISGNTAPTGGGLSFLYGQTTLTGDTISGNNAIGVGSGGGGIYDKASQTTITNCTITGNESSTGGGGIEASAISLKLTDSTLSGNSSMADPGGGLVTAYGATIDGTIIAGNFNGDVQTVGQAAAPNSLVGSNDLIGDGSGEIGGLTSSLEGTSASPIDPMLGALADNGGPTQTLALLTGSPAIGQGAVFAAANGIDQRGLSRPASGVDIGAFQSAAGTGGGSSSTGLTPSITKSTLPASIVGGSPLRGNVILSVDNTAATPDSGTVGVYASTDGSVDGSSVLLGSYKPQVNLKTGKSETIVVPVNSSSVPAGTYTILAQATDASSNVVASTTGPTLTVAAPFLAFSETVTTVGLASSVVSGTANHAMAKVVIKNSGNVNSKGRVTIAISASTTSDVAGTLINSISPSPVIRANGGTVTEFVPFKALPDLADNSYFITASVTDPMGGSSNASTVGTTTIAAPFIFLILTFGNTPRAVLTAGTPMSVDNDGNIDDTSAFTVTIGLATNMDGTGIAASGAGTLAPAKFTVRAGKTFPIHVTGWDPLLKSIVSPTSYFLTVTITDANGNSASVVSSGEI